MNAMNVGPILLGTFVLALVVVDVLWTTLWVEGGAGPLTAGVMALTWRAIRRAGRHSRRLHTLAGPLILVATLTIWITLLWGGWTLVFAGAEDALVDTLERGEVSWTDRAYYTGYTVFTLGIGDYVPRRGPWQIATVLASGTGLLFVTLAVTYVLSVLGAVTQKRSFASNVNGLGDDSTDVVLTGWSGDGFEGLEVPLNALSTQLNTLTSHHKAYPVVHYFHSAGAGQAPASTIPAFDEALTVLRFGVAEEARPEGFALRSARTSVANYLATVQDAFVNPTNRSPPPPDLEPLREAGIPTVPEEDFAAAVDDLDDRRRLLLGLVESDARRWP